MAIQQAIAKRKEDDIVFVPFGSDSEIKLSLNIIKQFVAEPGKGGELPDDRQSMKFMMLCRSRKLNPFEGDAFMIPFWSSRKNRYEWSLITAHAAFLKRAEVNPEYNGKSSGIIISPAVQCVPCGGSGTLKDTICPLCGGKGENDELEGDFMPETIGGEKVTLAGGWCRVFFKTRTKVEYQRLRLSTYKKQTSQWDDDPAGMICKCAEAAALRSAFPTTIGGLYLKEEVALRAEEDETIKRPVFQSPPEMTEPGKVLDAEITPEPTQEAQEPTKEEPPREEPSGNPIKKLRELCTEAKIKEVKLIDFLVETGSAEQGTSSLEQVMLEYPNVIDAVIKSWPKISQQIKGGAKCVERQTTGASGLAHPGLPTTFFARVDTWPTPQKSPP